jgi:hypothetical protein
MGTVGMVIAQVAGQCVAHDLRKEGEKARLEMERVRLSMTEKQHETMLLENYKNRKQGRENLVISEQLRQWKLLNFAEMIRRESQRREGRTLNIIACIVPSEDLAHIKAEKKELFNTIETIRSTFAIAAEAARHFGNDVHFYDHILTDSWGHGHTLRAALSGFLETEPTVLIELRALERDKIQFKLIEWGGFHQGTALSESRNIVIPLPPFPEPLIDATNKQAKATWIEQYKHIQIQRKTVLNLILSSLIVNEGDKFRATRHGHELPLAMFPLLLRDPAFGMLPESMPIDVRQWEPLIAKHIAMYDTVPINKEIRIKLIKQEAENAKRFGQDFLAEKLLEKVLHLETMTQQSKSFSDNFKEYLFQN